MTIYVIFDPLNEDVIGVTKSIMKAEVLCEKHNAKREVYYCEIKEFELEDD